MTPQDGSREGRLFVRGDTEVSSQARRERLAQWRRGSLGE